MNKPVLPIAPASGRSGPNGKTLLRWTAVVLAAHMGLLLGIAGTMDWRLPSQQAIRTGPLQTRWIAPPVNTAQVGKPLANQIAPARTRIAKVPQALMPSPGRPWHQTEANAKPSEQVLTQADVIEPPASAVTAAPLAIALPEKPIADEPSAPPPQAPLSEASATGLAASPTPTNAPTSAAEATARKDASTSLSGQIDPASMDLPSVSLAALPPSVVLRYRLNGQEKGIPYTATGELRWQHNDTAYDMSLSVKAFLLGTRHWRSQGLITSGGLAPSKFSDNWRTERATHFDRADHRIVFSSNAPPTPLLPGAQDQISLYPQLAAVMASAAQTIQPGTRLQVQTATVRDALPWLLTLEQIETISVNGQLVQSTKWVCQPRHRFDAKVEFWVAAEQGWLPVRIRITQVSGNFIDLNLSGHEALPPLPRTQPPG